MQTWHGPYGHTPPSPAASLAEGLPVCHHFVPQQWLQGREALRLEAGQGLRLEESQLGTTATLGENCWLRVIPPPQAWYQANATIIHVIPSTTPWYLINTSRNTSSDLTHLCIYLKHYAGEWYRTWGNATVCRFILINKNIYNHAKKTKTEMASTRSQHWSLTGSKALGPRPSYGKLASHRQPAIGLHLRSDALPTPCFGPPFEKMKKESGQLPDFFARMHCHPLHISPSQVVQSDHIISRNHDL